MTPQASFMILAPIVRDREATLRELLASMNHSPGQLNPNNSLIGFAQFDRLHFGRLLIVDDKTVDDVRLYHLTPETYPLYLAFLGDVDGDRDSFLVELAKLAATGLRTIFSCCEGFNPGTDLVGWMKEHSLFSSAEYQNWPGRSVRRIREEEALRAALDRYVQSNAAALAGMRAREIHAELRSFVNKQKSSGQLTLSPEDITPSEWSIRNWLHLIGIPLLVLIGLPILVPIGIIGFIWLRRLEKTDPEWCPRVEPHYSNDLALLEDHTVTNQFTAMGSLKPGIVRLVTAMAVLLGIDWFSRHIFTRGRLARVRTIHFARWVFLDGRKRVVFLSNYDGSLESYMDDFINKVGFGLNLVFSNGIGYPRTNYLVKDGCLDERKFKEYLRRHQLPTQVWYNAHPGLTAIDLEKNTLIRKGLESLSLSDQEARQWVALL
jgi:hypothetical protein